MDCLEFRQQAGADPGHLGAEAQRHLESCPGCTEFLRQTRELDQRILAALKVPVPEAGVVVGPMSGRIAAGGGAAALHPRASWPLVGRRRWFALAASVAGGVIVGSLLWVTGPRATLAGDLVRHIEHEPGAMVTTSTGAPPAEVAAVLARAGVDLEPGAGVVSYATTCPFRGHEVPHLVVQTGAGPVTVMVLRDEKVKAPQHFDEDGYAGTIVPSGPGSIAVIGNSPSVDVDQVVAHVQQSLTWR
jgi:hypothetical protein